MFSYRLAAHHPGLNVWQLAGIAAIRLVVVALLITAIVLIVRAVGRRTASRTPAAPNIETATQVLDERFARGEIDAEEYQNRRRVLQNNPRW